MFTTAQILQAAGLALIATGMITLIHMRIFPAMPPWLAVTVAMRWVAAGALATGIAALLIVAAAVPPAGALFFAMLIVLLPGIAAGILPARILK